MKSKKNLSLVFLIVVLKLTLDILVLLIKRKKKILSIYNGSFLSSLVVGGHGFFKFL